MNGWVFTRQTRQSPARDDTIQFNILSIFRKEPDGQWRLFRDANLLTPI
jgi:ketosteroid isomerase-like protein